jgi:hypothetical protein
MTITEVYNKYKHLDRLLSDEQWIADSLQGRILFDLWQAIKGGEANDHRGTSNIHTTTQTNQPPPRG